MPAESALSLVERLRAALDRAEEIARAVGQPHWSEDSAFLTDMVIPLPSQVRARPGWIPMITPEDIRHMAANDPAHVLRSVAAHRKLLERYETAVIARDVAVDTPLAGATRMALRLAQETLEIVASIYFPEETTDG